MLIERESDLPNLQGARRVAIDLETRDPNLLSEGPGDIRGDGHVAGIAVAVEDGPAVYVPIGHEAGHNLSVGPVVRWLRDLVDQPHLEVTGANSAAYDRGWLAAMGVRFRDDAKMLDTQLAEPLIDEQASSYSLNALAAKYLGEHKDEEAMYKWLAAKFGGRPTRRAQAKNIWRAPPEVVHDYGIGDVILPLRILREQEKVIRDQGLEEVWALEQDIAHATFYMRQRGVRVDLTRAEQLAERLSADAKKAQRHLGKEVSVWAQNDLAALYDRAGIEYLRTPERLNDKGLTTGGNPSFPQAWLKKRAEGGCRLSQDILNIRKAEKAVGTFVRGYVLERHVNGRVHAMFNQLRTDEGTGTVSGRFSSSNPNLQNIPARDPELGPLIRGLFVPDDDCDWVKHDYAQIEPRLTLHYAPGPVAERVREKYRRDPTIDCYLALLEEAPDGITRTIIKTVWLGLLYGMGKAKLAGDLGVTPDEADHLIRVFHDVAPYVKSLKRGVETRAKRRGYIHTLSGRRARFEYWEPAKFELAKGFQALPTRAEVVEWLKENGHSERRVKRAWVHKALNRLIQGGAADIMKQALAQQWRSGVWDVLGAPLVTVHDENDWSVPRTAEGREAIAEARRIMTHAVELRLPLYVDEEIGPNWGDVKEVK